MAFENPHEILEGLLAGEDLSLAQDCLVVVDNTGKAVLNTVAGGLVDGVLMGKPTTGQPASVACSGRAIVKCGAAVDPGDPVQSDDQGRAIKALTATYAFGRALTGTTQAGERLTVNVKPFGYLP